VETLCEGRGKSSSAQIYKNIREKKHRRLDLLKRKEVYTGLKGDEEKGIGEK